MRREIVGDVYPVLLGNGIHWLFSCITNESPTPGLREQFTLFCEYEPGRREGKHGVSNQHTQTNTVRFPPAYGALAGPMT